MRRIAGKTISLIAALIFLFAYQAIAAETNPNGFPIGPHYNLYIVGIKVRIPHPEQLVDKYANPVYGNVIFLPEKGWGMRIYMQSGTGEEAAAVTKLQVIDPFAVFDGDGAVVQIPKHEAGYRIYARAWANPYDDSNSNSPDNPDDEPDDNPHPPPFTLRLLSPEK